MQLTFRFLLCVIEAIYPVEDFSLSLLLIHLYNCRMNICINTSRSLILSLLLFVPIIVCVSAELCPLLFISLAASVSVTPLVSAPLMAL